MRITDIGVDTQYSECKRIPSLVLPTLEPRLAPFPVILGLARQRELVDIHVARQVIKRVRKPVNRQFGHRDRQWRLGGDFGCERHRGVEGFAGIGNLLHQPPFIGLPTAR